jgi:hypothetical protein
MGAASCTWPISPPRLPPAASLAAPVVTRERRPHRLQSPVRVGGILVIKAVVNFSHRTSMECGVSMWAEDRASGRRYKVATAYLTFVALDENTGRPRPVPRVVPDTDVEKRRYQDAENRRQRRIQGLLSRSSMKSRALSQSRVFDGRLVRAVAIALPCLTSRSCPSIIRTEEYP